MTITQIAEYLPRPPSTVRRRLEGTARQDVRRSTPQGDAELMTKKQVLGFKPAPRLEQVNNEHSE
jgi:hypothetical protein